MGKKKERQQSEGLFFQGQLLSTRKKITLQKEWRNSMATTGLQPMELDGALPMIEKKEGENYLNLYRNISHEWIFGKLVLKWSITVKWEKRLRQRAKLSNEILLEV